MDIVKQLVSQLGVSEEQAQGGAGLILGYAKKTLGDADFGKIEEAVPEASQLVQQAPEPDADAGGAGGMLAGVASAVGGALGGVTGGLGGLAGLAGGFSKLGLDASQVGDFAKTVMNFLEEKGGAKVKELLAGVLK